MTFDIMDLAAILRDAARAEALPRFRRLDAGMVKVKTEAIDLVTEADIATENVIKLRIAEWMPGALFVGEESVAADPALRKRIGDANRAKARAEFEETTMVERYRALYFGLMGRG